MNFLDVNNAISVIAARGGGSLVIGDVGSVATTTLPVGKSAQSALARLPILITRTVLGIELLGKMFHVACVYHIDTHMHLNLCMYIYIHVYTYVCVHTCSGLSMCA